MLFTGVGRGYGVLVAGGGKEVLLLFKWMLWLKVVRTFS